MNKWNWTEDPDVDIPMDIWFWLKQSETHTGKNTTSLINGSDQTGYLYAEECKETQTYHPAQNSAPKWSRTST